MSLSMAAWLGLREGADAAARAGELLDPLRRLLRAPLVIHDLGCGTGSMGRWLAGRLPGPQHWLGYDRDAELLAHATGEHTAADGSTVTVETREQDIGGLAAGDLDGASLVTASALLDMLTGEEVETIAAACAGAGCPALLTLSVVGRVALDPADPLDEQIAAAFNDHQRRVTGGRRLGPDAPGVAAGAFRRLGARVLVRPSPWRLGPAQAALTGEWLREWVGAACEQRPDLAVPAGAYLKRRLAAAAAGELRVEVGHSDLLAYRDEPPAPRGT
jgi:SAM-dependent methyltransferase